MYGRRTAFNQPTALRHVPQVLKWEPDPVFLVQSHDRYVDLLIDAAGLLVQRVSSSHPVLADRLRSALSEGSDRALMRALTAPEGSYQLIWRQGADPFGAARSVLSGLTAELIREGKRERPSRATWTLLGEQITSDRIRRSFIAHRLLLDLDSPWARKINRDEAERPTPPAPEQRSTLVQVLEDALRRIEDTSLYIADFVARFTKVLVVANDGSRPDASASSSSGQYIGRTLLLNPLAPGTAGSDVADSLVHEAIHSLLYMHEICDGWVEDPLRHGVTPDLVSPWSGQLLRLRPFLQACFVWFGLWQFWRRAEVAHAWPHTATERRQLISARGFMGNRLTDLLAPYSRVIAADVVGCIDAMQDAVVAAFASDSAGRIAA